MTDREENEVAALCSDRRYEAAYALLVRSQTPPLLRLAVRMGLDSDDAQDVLQDAFINIWRALPQFRGDAKFSTWTYRIVANEALAALRKQQKRRLWTVRASDAPEAVATSASDDVYFQADDALALLHRAQAQLPEKQRLVFQLRYFEELPYSEIATITGTSEGGLKANYHHAVQKIRALVQTVKPNPADDLLTAENE
jgi:RNA polymerase sigma-70 factor (ECF subfamily)